MGTQDIEKLILAVLSRIRERSGFATKTKLLKLLYLIDVEYYRRHGSTFTSLNWIYYHLGPWTKQYDQILERLTELGKIQRQLGTRPDLETQFFTAIERVEIDSLFPESWDRHMTNKIIDAFANLQTVEILDYVYFKTEPMHDATRGDFLDFSKIEREDQPQLYYRPTSSLSAKEKQELRKKARKLSESVVKDEEVIVPDPPPRYDDEYYEAMRLLNERP